MQIQSYNVNKPNLQQPIKPAEKKAVETQQKTKIEKTDDVKQTQVQQQIKTPTQDVQSVLNTMQYQVKNKQAQDIQQQNNEKKVAETEKSSKYYE